ncbi:hypothetical protein EJB05_46207 [Eragrostis curvula]|uniref:Uncharacterized protein n=1 Tax=Eragrostis curvula TaxID=38414 RepID=A0A5J9TMB2_9POAL|nr:hypothetical protein EJB05_46207 [Eragrostis curvula]
MSLRVWHRSQQPFVGYVEFARSDVALWVLDEMPVGTYQVEWATGNLSDNRHTGFTLRHRGTPIDQPFNASS